MNLNQINTIVHLQDQLNRETNGNDWVIQGHDWRLAIWTECAELMNELDWKWWKEKTEDREKIIGEAVDVLHFAISLAIEEELSQADIEDNMQINHWSSMTQRIHCINEIAFSALIKRETGVILHYFSALLMSLDISFDEIFDRYVNKNVLNIFRRKNGYKEGTYNRTWNGKDDNDVLVEVAATMDRDSENYFDELYAKLEEIYHGK